MIGCNGVMESTQGHHMCCIDGLVTNVRGHVQQLFLVARIRQRRNDEVVDEAVLPEKYTRPSLREHTGHYNAVNLPHSLTHKQEKHTAIKPQKRHPKYQHQVV